MLKRRSAAAWCGLAAILWTGLWAAHRCARRADENLRTALLDQALAVARTVGPEQVKTLSFTAEDRDSATYQRLSRQMRAYAETMGLHSLYTLARRDGRLVFGPEGIREGTRLSSPPGTLYQKPSDKDLAFFQKGIPTTMGPQTDEYGTFISALAPVLDPITGEVLLAVGMDLEVATWRAALSKARRIPLLIAIGWLALLEFGLIWCKRLSRKGAPDSVCLQNLPVMNVVLAGLAVTGMASWLAHDLDQQVRQSGFKALSRAEVSSVIEAFWRVRERLESLARFFEASESVSAAEFRVFAEPLAQDGLSQYWEWIPQVRPEERILLERHAAQEGRANWELWEAGPSGKKQPVRDRPVYYPVYYSLAQPDYQPAFGYDVASNPSHLAVIEEAMNTGLVTASDPFPLVQDPGSAAVIFLCRRVICSGPPPDASSGLVATLLRPKPLVEQSLREADAPPQNLDVDLFQLQVGRPPKVLGSSHDSSEPEPHTWPPADALVQPIFAFGKVYALLTHPRWHTPGLPRVTVGRVVGIAGVLLTLIASLLVSVLLRHRASLQHEVEFRTAELREKTDELNRFFSSALDMLCIADAEYRFRRLNREWTEVLGYPPEELLGKRALSVVVPEDRAETLRKFNLLRQGQDIGPVVSRCRCRDGSSRWIEWQVAPSGTFFFAAGRDITGRRQAEAQLRLQAQLLDCVSESVVATDTDGRILYWGPGAEKLYGISTADVLGRPYREIAGPIDPPQDEIAFRRLVLAQGVWHGEHRQRKKDGTIFWTSTFISPVRDEQGRHQGFIGIDLDITEQRRMAETLQALSARQEALLSAIPDIIMEVDADKVYTWANTAGLDFFGPEVIGREAAFYFEGDQETYAEVQPLFNGQEQVIYVESWQRRRDGQKRLLAWWCRVLKDEKGHVTGALSTARDITEQRLVEEQLRQNQKIEAVGRLAGGVAHDFNNMIGVILGHIGLALTQNDMAPALHEHLQSIQEAAQRSAALTRQLLAFARKQTVRPRILDLNETIAGMLKLLHRLIGEGIELAWKPGAGLWPISMDPTQVDQVLANLTVNARDAIGEHGTLTLETGNVTLDRSGALIHSDAAPGDYVKLEVRDTGSGMEAAVLRHIFEPFFTTKEKGIGTGLGLATVYGIVRQNNGFITVSSRPGHGSTFQLYFPRSPDAIPPEEPEAARPIPKGTETVLIVEDSLPLLKLCRNILERLGYTVLSADIPQEAFARVREHPTAIDLLIADVVMPEMNGRELAEQIKGRCPLIKVLFMSGYTADVIARHGILDPGLQFIQKPFTVEAFAEKVREVLDG